MRQTGTYAVYRGREYRVGSVSATTVDLPCDRAALEAGEFPDAVQGDTGSEPSWVTIPKRALDSYVKVHLVASWRGREVTVARIENDQAGLHFQGSPAFAEENGMTGDQYNGWGAWVALDELSDVREEIKELPR